MQWGQGRRAVHQEPEMSLLPQSATGNPRTPFFLLPSPWQAPLPTPQELKKSGSLSLADTVSRPLPSQTGLGDVERWPAIAFVLGTASQPLSVCLSVFGTKENGHTEPTGASYPSVLWVFTWGLFGQQRGMSFPQKWRARGENESRKD